MDVDSIAAAINAIVTARRHQTKIPALLFQHRPTTMADARAIQDQVIATLGARAGDCKVTLTPQGEIIAAGRQKTVRTADKGG